MNQQRGAMPARRRAGVVAAAVAVSIALLAGPALSAEAQDAPWTASVAGSSASLIGASRTVPDVVGKTVAAARLALAKVSLKVAIKSSTGAPAVPGSDWIVVRQSVRALSKVKSGTVVTLIAAPTRPTSPTPAAFYKSFPSFSAKIAAGGGNSVITLPAGASAGIVKVSYGGTTAFMIQGIDGKGKSTPTFLLKATGSYSGTTAFGLTPTLGAAAVSLRVTTSGPWSVSISPLASAPQLPPGRWGDGVYKYDGPTKNWAVTSTGIHGFFLGQFFRTGAPTVTVSTTGVYSGKVACQAGPSLIVIHTDGAWTAR
jgi:PASTA domain